MEKFENVLISMLDSYSNEYVSYTKVLNFIDGTAMSDAKCDGAIYRKLGGDFYIRNFTGDINSKWFGAKADGDSDDYEALFKANEIAFKMGKSLILEGVHKIESSLTFTAKIKDTFEQIFTLDSNITIAGNDFVRPDWFGDVLYSGRKAIDVLPESGGVIKLRNKSYKPFYPSTEEYEAEVTYIAKDNVSIIGDKMPILSSLNEDYVYTKLDGGSVIQGTLAVFANNFTIKNVGVDCGIDASDEYYEGVGKDAFFFFKPQQSVETPNARNFVAENIVGLCRDKNTLAHAILFEAIDGGYASNINCFGAYHGIVIKSINFNLSGFNAQQNKGNSLIIKSDTYAICGNVNVSNGIILGGGFKDETIGVYVLGESSTINNVNISNVYIYNKSIGLQVKNNGNIVNGLLLDNITVDTVDFGVDVTNFCVNIRANNIYIRDTSYFGFSAVNCYGGGNSITNSSVANCTTGVSIDGIFNFDNNNFSGVTDKVFEYSTIDSRLQIGSYTIKYSPSAIVWELYQALSNGWTDDGSFKIVPFNNKIILKGKINPSLATSDVFSSVSIQIRPDRDITLPTFGLRSGVLETIYVTLKPNGDIITSDYTGFDYIILDGLNFDLF